MGGTRVEDEGQSPQKPKKTSGGEWIQTFQSRQPFEYFGHWDRRPSTPRPNLHCGRASSSSYFPPLTQTTRHPRPKLRPHHQYSAFEYRTSLSVNLWLSFLLILNDENIGLTD